MWRKPYFISSLLMSSVCLHRCPSNLQGNYFSSLSPSYFFFVSPPSTTVFSTASGGFANSIMSSHPQKETPCYLPLFTAASRLLLCRALGLRCVCRGGCDTLTVSARREIERNLIILLQLSLLLASVRNRTEAEKQASFWERDQPQYSVRTPSRPLSWPCFTPDGHILSHKPPSYPFTVSFFLACFPLPFLSKWIKQPYSFLFHLSHLDSLHIFPNMLSALSRLPPRLPVSLHAHLLSLTDSIPDGAPLLATHRQINQSNNTPINSDYALISPGRTLHGAGKDVALVE